jgi:hypothetical protein
VILRGCLGLAIALAAHGKGRLVLPHSTAAAGDTLHVQGKGFAPGRVTLELRGALATYPVAGVEVGRDSSFAVAWAVPKDARTGAYRLVAIADDGDEITRADVTLTDAVAASPTPVEHAAHAGAPGAAEPAQAHAGAFPLERSRSAAEWTVILLCLGGSLVAGLRWVRS